MGWKELTGSVSPALSAIKFDQDRQSSEYSQTDGVEFDSSELYNYVRSCSNNSNSDKQYKNVAVCINGKEKVKNFFLWAGKQSLEIYMIHGLLLNIFKSNVTIQFSSIEGYLLTAGNFVLTIGLCSVAIDLLNQNSILKKVLNLR